MKYLFVIIFIILSYKLFAQEVPVKCGTEDQSIEYVASQPWYGNEEFLQHFSDSILTTTKGKTNSLVENAVFRVPVQFWVYTMEDISIEYFLLTK